MSTRTFSIGALAREFGVTLRTLRLYEVRGLLNPDHKGQERVYSAEDRDRIALIVKGKALGFSLTEINGMLPRWLDAGRVVLTRDEFDAQVQHLSIVIADATASQADLEVMASAEGFAA